MRNQPAGSFGQSTEGFPRRAGAYVAMTALVVLYICLFALKDILGNVNAFLIIDALIFAVYGSLMFFILRYNTRGTAWFIAGAGVIAILLLLMRTNMSTDIYRYLWDGWLLKSGINPYLVVPKDPYLVSFQMSNLYRTLAWKAEYTPYPPVAQLVFAVAHTGYAAIGLAAAKVVLALPVVALAAFLRQEEGNRFFVLFVTNPLLLFETFYGGHIDAWAVLFALLAYRQYVGGGFALSASLLALGTLTKVFPAIFLPLFVADLLRRRRFRDAIRYLVLFVAIVAGFYLPFVIASPFPLLRFLSFAKTFHFNGPVFSLLASTLPPAAAPQESALKICAIALALSLIYLTVRHRPTVLALSAAYALYLLFSFQIYPWYTLFLAPMLFLAAGKAANPRYVVGLVVMQFLLHLTYFVGSPIAWRAQPEQKLLVANVFMGIELLATIAIFVWLTALRLRPARSALPAAFRISGERPEA